MHSIKGRAHLVLQSIEKLAELLCREILDFGCSFTGNLSFAKESDIVRPMKTNSCPRKQKACWGGMRVEVYRSTTPAYLGAVLKGVDEVESCGGADELERCAASFGS